jgi:hypothetical protein
MSQGTVQATAFYDAIREQYCNITDSVDPDRRRAVLAQMAAALASVIVERAPDEAERIWLGASFDVRLRPAPKRRRRFNWRGRFNWRAAAARMVWPLISLFCVIELVGLARVAVGFWP